MVDERIGIIVTDKVDSTIATKFRGIASAARSANSDIEKVKQQLASINGNGLTLLAQQYNNIARISKQLNAVQIQTNQQNVILNQTATQAATAVLKLATAQTQSAAAQAKLAQAQQQLTVSQQNAAQAIIRTAQAMAGLTIAQNNSAASAAKLAVEQAKVAQANANTATQATIAAQKIATAGAQTLTAQQRLLEAQGKTARSAVELTTAQQRLATEQQRTANAATLATTATVNLTTAQTKATAALQLITQAANATIVSQNNVAASATKATIATVNLTTANNNAATAAQRLITEQQRTTKATTDAAISATNALTARSKLTEAQNKALQSAVNLTTAQQRLATEIQRTAVQTANAAAAADRARLAALQLADAHNRVGSASNGAANSLLNYAKAAALAIGTAMGAESVLKTADAYTTMQNKLVNVATSQEAVNTLTDDMFKLADKTGQSVLNTTSAFQKFDNAMLQMGRGQAETLRLVETLNKATVISGATTAEAASGILQLGQAFGSGKLQGEEFRAIMENLPVVADLIASSMGKTRGELKALSSQGKITAEEIRVAFEKSATTIDDKFAKTTFTLAQTFTIMNNRFTQWVGNLNKATGLTATLSTGINWLSKNLDTVAVSLAVASSLLLVAFGPTLIGMIVAATKAMWGFSAALAANPVGLLIVGITSASAYIAAFGDEIKMSADGFVTLKDYGRAALSFIVDGFKATTSFIADTWNTAIDFLSDKTGGFAEHFRDIFGLILNGAKMHVNLIIAIFVGGVSTIIKQWQLLPSLMQAVFANIVNFGASAVETLVNSWQMGLRGIATLAANVAPNMADSLNKALDSVSLELPRMKVGREVSSMAAEIGNEFTKAFKKDYVGDAANAFMKRARDMAVNRVGINTGPGELRGEGVAPPKSVDEKANKLAEKRATIMAKINGELDSQIKNMFKLATQREIDSQFDTIVLNLAQKKITLTEGEAKSIRNKIAAVEQAKVVQKQYDAIYEEATGPMRTYYASLEAVDKLLAASAITQEKATEFVRKFTEARMDAIDPLRAFNRETDQQLKLLAIVGPQQEIERAIMQKQNELRAEGKTLTAEENNQMRAKLVLVQQATDLQAVLNDHYNATVAKQTELATKQQAYNMLLASGKMNGEQYGIAMQKLAVDFANLKLAMGTAGFEDMVTSSLGRITAGYQGVMSGMTTAFGDFFTSFTDGFADSIGKAVVYSDSLSDAMKDLSKQILSGLISALVKLGIQYAVNAALGTSISASAMAAQTGLSTAAAAVTATAWATPAALVSLASFGANSVPAMAGITATTALSQGMALASMLPGFETGGYTGNSGRSDVAGVVHGQEFVMTADATRRNRPILEAMNNGVSVSKSSSGDAATGGNVGNGVTITIENYGTDIDVDASDESNIRIIARQVASEVVREQAPSVIAASMRSANSQVSKAMSASTTVQRKRNN